MELLEQIGLTKEELQERVVAKIASEALTTIGIDDEGNEYGVSSALQRKVDDACRKAIGDAVNRLAESNILPAITGRIESIVLQKTNEWGEPKGDPMGFVEYLQKRADQWITEDVNYEGKSKAECRDSYGGFKKNGTRIAYMIDQHLQYSIQRFAENALKSVNGQIAEGITAAVKTQLENVLAGLKVTATVKS